ncbi:MAG: hypothetical protein ABIR94_17500 [Rubrivivax sp.]
MHTLDRLLFVLAVVIAVAGCGSLPGTGEASDKVSRSGDAQLDLLNQGYSLLYADVSGLRLVDKLLLVKFESDSTQAIVEAISDYSAKLATQLEGVAKRYPSVRIDLQPLPEVEKRTRAAANKERALSFAPLVGRSGADFERTLLLTLSGALNQLRFLAQVTAQEERNDERRALLEDAQKNFDSLYRRTLKLLDERYYKHTGR